MVLCSEKLHFATHFAVVTNEQPPLIGMAETKVIELEWPWLHSCFFFVFFLTFTSRGSAAVVTIFISIAKNILAFGGEMGASYNLGLLKSPYLFTSLLDTVILN